MIRLLFFILPLFLGLPVLSQELLSDSLFVVRVLQNTKDNYSIYLNNKGQVYNGKVYKSFGLLSDNEHTFFLNEEFTPGTIGYDGYTYKNVKIKYDLNKDQLVLLHLDGITEIVVPPELVDFFSLYNHKYLNVKLNSYTSIAGIKPGYYDLLYDGKTDLLAKRVKTVSEKITQTQVERTVAQYDKYYLLKDSVYIAIKNKKVLLKLLRSTQSQNQQFIKAKQLSFKSEKEKAMIELVKFHDSIVLP